MCDLICAVIRCYVFEAAAWVKSNVYEKIMIKTLRKHKNQRNFYKSPSNKWSRNGIHSLLNRADARRSADIIYRM